MKEIEEAEEMCVYKVQQDCFPEEIICLRNKKPINKNSKLKNLCPELTQEILTVGGRTILSPTMTEYAKHSAILDLKHRFTQMYIWFIHKIFRHHGV